MSRHRTIEGLRPVVFNTKLGSLEVASARALVMLDTDMWDDDGGMYRAITLLTFRFIRSQKTKRPLNYVNSRRVFELDIFDTNEVNQSELLSPLTPGLFVPHRKVGR